VKTYEEWTGRRSTLMFFSTELACLHGDSTMDRLAVPSRRDRLDNRDS
jgi:hypothetical protein